MANKIKKKIAKGLEKIASSYKYNLRKDKSDVPDNLERRRFPITAAAYGVLLYATIYGCQSVPTRFEGKWPASLTRLHSISPDYAKELIKIPDIRDGISKRESITIDRIADMITSNPKVMKKQYGEWDAVGGPKRKFCTPIESMFDLVSEDKLRIQDGVLQVKTDVMIVKNEGVTSKKGSDKPWGNRWNKKQSIHYEYQWVNYTLERMIRESWKNEGSFLTHNQILDVIQGTKDSSYKRMYEGMLKRKVEISKIQKYILQDLKKDSSIFSTEAKKIINIAKKHTKWDFETSVQRLNDPVLIDWYIKKNISYRTIRGITYSPKHVFQEQWGDSDDLATFGKYLLDEAGFSTFYITAKDPLTRNFHPGSGIRLEDGSYKLVVDFGSGHIGNISNVIFKRRSELYNHLYERVPGIMTYSPP